jgi:hypothetical protein
MKRREPTRTDFAIVKVVQSIRSCETYEQLRSCKQLIRLLKRVHSIRYITEKYLILRYKQKLYELREE